MEWLETAKKIVTEHQFRYVHPVTGVECEDQNIRDDEENDEENNVVLLDVMTASLLVQVCSALSQKNKENFVKLPLTRAVALAWKVVR